jgi:hypothetical protein
MMQTAQDLHLKHISDAHLLFVLSAVQAGRHDLVRSKGPSVSDRDLQMPDTNRQKLQRPCQLTHQKTSTD